MKCVVKRLHKNELRGFTFNFFFLHFLPGFVLRVFLVVFFGKSWSVDKLGKEGSECGSEFAVVNL